MIKEFSNIIRYTQKPLMFFLVFSSYCLFALAVIFTLSDLLPQFSSHETLWMGVSILLFGMLMQLFHLMIMRDRMNMHRLYELSQQQRAQQPTASQKETTQTLEKKAPTLTPPQSDSNNPQNIDGKEIANLNKLSHSLDTPMKGLAETRYQENIQLIRHALDHDRAELFLQPIFHLDQMRPHFFESYMRIKGEDNQIYTASQFITIAEEENLISAIDNALLLKIVAMIRKFVANANAPIIFFNLSVKSLDVKGFMEEFSNYLTLHPQLAQNIIFEFNHESVKHAKHGYHEFISKIKPHGYYFSLDHITDDNLFIEDYVAQGYRYFKIPAKHILQHNDVINNYTNKIKDMNQTYHQDITMIATHIDERDMLDELRKIDIHFAQGYILGDAMPEQNFLG